MNGIEMRASKMNKDKQKLIETVLDIELKMFLTVPTLEKANCQDHPDEFKRNRLAQFSTWSEETLSSYLKDLMLAEEGGKNLMTLKYARMENKIACLNEDPLIEKIIEAQYRWQKELFTKYPHLMRGARAIDSEEDSAFHTSFETYLRGELETYSPKTLSLLYKDVQNCLQKKENMNEQLYDFLVKTLGYKSLEEAERANR